MGVNLKKEAIDLGIITNNAEAMVAFYRDVLGLKELPPLTLPGMRIEQFACGESTVKIVTMKRPVTNECAPGGLSGATGMRYFTMWVANLAEIVAACEAAQATIAVPIAEIAPGTTIAIVEDPDGNWVEFVQVV
jgi:catechol 2,3-dioxygenase-like lactoylglutathione lyase family enzyme